MDVWIKYRLLNDKRSHFFNLLLTFSLYWFKIGNEKCVQILIENGATANAKDYNGDEPLQIAFKEGNRLLNFIIIVKILLLCSNNK